MTKSKKTQVFLGERIVSWILSILGLLALVFFIVILYMWISGAGDTDKAKSSIAVLKGNIPDVKNIGEFRDVTLNGPEGWLLLSFSPQSEMPVDCPKGKDCLCFCQGSNKGERVTICNSGKSVCDSVSIPIEATLTLDDSSNDLRIQMIDLNKLNITLMR